MTLRPALAGEFGAGTSRSLLACFFGCVLGACSVLSPDVGAVSERAPGPAPRNYRQLIADGAMEFTTGTRTAEEAAKQAAKERNLTAVQLNEERRNAFLSRWTGAEVSMLRQTQGPQLGDWMACLRASKSGRVTYIAFFFENEKILDFRTAIMSDRCEGESYAALPPRSPPPTKKPDGQPQEKK